jgi:hypothetical protein
MWCGEDFHELGVQGVEVLTVLCASPLPSMAPESQQGLWFMELMLSASVSQSPSSEKPVEFLTLSFSLFWGQTQKILLGLYSLFLVLYQEILVSLYSFLVTFLLRRYSTSFTVITLGSTKILLLSKFFSAYTSLLNSGFMYVIGSW